MKNKTRILFFCMFFIMTAAADDTPHFGKCLQWKQACQKKSYCLPQKQKQDGCYRCVRPGRYGFHIYPHQVERQTCDVRTVDDLRSMGYNCYSAIETTACVKSTEKKVCDWECEKYKD